MPNPTELPTTETDAEALQKIAGNAGELPALPDTALRAMELIDDPNACARQLQFVIGKDQALTARILRIVNSAMYGFEREVSTLSHAIAILGLDTVRSVIVAACVQQIHQMGSSTGKDLTGQLFWQHSWGAAAAAKAIALETRYPILEEAFTCGLLHDMGKTVLLRNRGQQYREILNDVYRGEVTFLAAEQAAFGFTHAHVGALVASRWRFPPQLIEGILYHHDFGASPRYRRLAAITALADRIMAALGVGFQKTETKDLAGEACVIYLKLSDDVLKMLMANIQTMILTLPGNTRL